MIDLDDYTERHAAHCSGHGCRCVETMAGAAGDSPDISKAGEAPGPALSYTDADRDRLRALIRRSVSGAGVDVSRLRRDEG